MLEKVFTIFFLLVSVAFGKTLPDGTNQTHRQKISIDNTKVNATLTNFPALVTEANLNSTFLSECQSDGDDIRFTSDEAGDTQLAQDIEQYTTNGAAVNVWVKIASVSSSVDTDIWAWCGDASATAPARTATYGAENVWRTEYKGVYHLHEGDATTSGFYKDMTSNNNDGTLTDVGATQVNGQIGKAMNLNGTDDYITITSTDFEIVDVSIQAWIKIDTDGGRVFLSHQNITSWQAFINGTSPNVTVTGDAGDGDLGNNTGGALSTGTFYMSHSVFDDTGADQRVYLDGTEVAGGAITTMNAGSGDPTIIGSKANTARSFKFAGTVDEVRIYSGVLPSGWISSEHNNQNSPSTFWTAGATEQLLKRRFLL